ncbi:uncharacterized protein [Henckelia pumila]|uniref:uncharacterized protein n=1 Tax=Henckelia pumila TaxID=405737 RepID=UPI003C6E17F8
MDATLTPMEVLFDQFQTYDPPTLKGTEDDIACESWLEELDHLFESLEYSDERRIRLIIYQLRDLARSWLFATKQSLENRGTVITWKVFKTEFCQRFLPISFREDRAAEFVNQQQGNLTVESYVAKFFNLLRFVPPVVDDEEVQANLFINGLNPDVYAWINAERPNSLVEAIDKAKRAEAGFMTQNENLIMPQYVVQPQFHPQLSSQSRFEAGGSGSNIKERLKL